MQKLRGQVSEDMILHGKTFELLFSAGFGSTWRCSKIQQNDGPAFVGWPDLSCQMDVNSEVGTNGKVTSLATSWSLPCLDASTMMYIHTTLSSYINTINTVLIVNPLRCSKGHDPSIIFHPFKAFYDHMIINEAMQKRHGCHLQVTVVNVNTPSGEDGAAIEIEWFHGHPASFLDTSSEISHPIHLIHLEARLSICLHKLPHRDTDICAIPSNSTRGKTTPPKFASRKILVNDASVRQAKAALNGQSSRVFTSSQIPHCGSRGYSPVQPEVPEASTCPSLSIVDSDTETSPLFGEGTIMKEIA